MRTRSVSVVWLLLVAAMLLSPISTPVAGGACTGTWSATGLGPQGIYLDVAATSPTDAWAIGEVVVTSGDTHRIVHWDGATWTTVSAPATSEPSLGRGIEAVGPNDIWAFGTYVDPVSFRGRVLIQHWNGSVWTNVNPPIPGNSGRIYEGSSVASDDVWAVGQIVRSGRFKALALHWNGSTWTEISPPTPSTKEIVLFGVHARASNDVWAVGQIYPSSKPYIAHYDETGWTKVPTPSVVRMSLLNDIVATSATEAWAVGHINNSNQILIYRWNGTSFTIAPHSVTAGVSRSLNDVDAVSPGEVYAVGGVGETPLLLLWNGASWQRVPVPGTGARYVGGVDALPDGTVFGAGLQNSRLFGIQLCAP